MTNRSSPTTLPLPVRDFNARGEAGSGVSWGAVVAGALGAAALSLVLLLLGSGLGLASMSPWSFAGASGATIGISAILWLSFTQVAASGLGGYLAGRLRVRWFSVSTDEVYFRDTAHGFLSWAVASVLSASLLSTVIGSIVNAGAHSVASVGAIASTALVSSGVSAAGQGPSDSGDKPMGRGVTSYFSAILLRRDAEPAAAGSAASASSAASLQPPSWAGTDSDDARASSEVAGILTHGLTEGALAPQDAEYLGRIVAQRTRLSQLEAQRRVTDTFARLRANVQAAEATLREAADKARKAAAYASMWMVVALMLGAFVASLAATYGGRSREAF